MTNPLSTLRFRLDHRYTTARLSEYIDGELVLRTRVRIERHVGDCPECDEALRTLTRLLGLLHGLPPVSDAEHPDIAAAVRRRLREPSPH